MKSIENVTFAQLRAFALVAKSGSFARAADEMDISQPAVSEQVKILERKLNKKLFDRRRGTTPTLTEAGQHVLEEVDTIFAALAKIEGSDDVQAEPIRLTISVSPKMRELYLNAVLPKFYSSHPNIEIQVPAKRSLKEEVQALDAGELDLAIFTLPKDIVPPDARILRSIPVMLVASPTTKLQLEAANYDYSGFEFVLNVRNAEARRWAREYLVKIGIAPNVPPTFIEFSEVTCQLVEEGSYIGYIAKQWTADKLASGALVALDLEVEPWQRCILRSHAAPPLAQELEDFLSRALDTDLAGR